MIDRIRNWALIGAAALALSACGAVQNVADRVNPFDNDSGPDQGETPDESRRVSLISAESQLEVDEALAGGAPPPPAAAAVASWPVEGGSATHAIGHAQLPGSIRRAWSSNAGEGSGRESRVVAPPVMADGRVFVMDGQGDVAAFNASTGSRLWSENLRSGARRDREGRGGGVAYADGRVYAASGFGFITALDANTGAQIWRRDLAGPMHSPPTIADGRLFAISFDNELYALSTEDGSVLWSYRGLAEPARILAAASPAVIGEVVLAPFASGEIIALRVENGREIWSQALTSAARSTGLSSLNDIAGSPVVAGDHVYAASHSGILAALDLRTGERVWESPAGGISMPWVVNDTIYVVTNNAQVVALRRTDGAVYWVTQLRQFENEERRRGRIAWAGPVLAGGRLYVVSSEEDMVALDPRTGDRVGDFDLGDPAFISPIVAGGTLYVLTDDATLLAFR